MGSVGKTFLQGTGDGRYWRFYSENYSEFEFC